MSGIKCRCGAEALEDHILRVAAGNPPHVYTGHYWGPDHQDWYEQADDAEGFDR